MAQILILDGVATYRDSYNVLSGGIETPTITRVPWLYPIIWEFLRTLATNFSRIWNSTEHRNVIVSNRGRGMEKRTHNGAQVPILKEVLMVAWWWCNVFPERA